MNRDEQCSLSNVWVCVYCLVECFLISYDTLCPPWHQRLVKQETGSAHKQSTDRTSLMTRPLTLGAQSSKNSKVTTQTQIIFTLHIWLCLQIPIRAVIERLWPCFRKTWLFKGLIVLLFKQYFNPGVLWLSSGHSWPSSFQGSSSHQGQKNHQQSSSRGCESHCPGAQRDTCVRVQRCHGPSWGWAALRRHMQGLPGIQSRWGKRWHSHVF